MTRGDAVATPSLRLLGVAVDVYKRIFTTPAISPPNPVRHSGFDLDVVVESVCIEAVDVESFTLVAATGDPLPAWRPGSHLDVFLPSGRQRQYSLCGDPSDRDRYRIAVRRIAGGDGGSREMHTLRPGDALRIRGPRNAFTFVETAPSYLFLAAGIGITPILPMVRAAGRRGHLVYTGRTRATMPFLDELPLHADIRPDDEYGPPDVPAILATAAPGAAVYVCGPPPVLAAAQRSFFSLDPTGSLHTERFSALPVTDGRAFPLRLARTGTQVTVGSRETVLDAVRRVKSDAVYSCRQGFCGTCRTRVLAGEVEHRDRLLTPGERAEHMLTCVSRSTGGPLVLDL
ncbi:Phthalate dioxygenase reductase [Nocardia otitidiscaviarum]|uniref:Phthalate dioxygenase reductase n=1 Tax=Nocardia otitidiscaviarum TaxID=1823 RepID=A0A379JLQ4_9NOCA|nr:PDR/VanB family oxidoreductase [Nocardia otitidiscaviarum]SUD49294.1 Phthalate dioxygenase reductase [Nocardia otitidiscaviarum]